MKEQIDVNRFHSLAAFRKCSNQLYPDWIMMPYRLDNIRKDCRFKIPGEEWMQDKNLWYYSHKKMSEHHWGTWLEDTKTYIFCCIKFKESSIHIIRFTIISNDLLKTAHDLFRITELIVGNYCGRLSRQNLSKLNDLFHYFFIKCFLKNWRSNPKLNWP